MANLHVLSSHKTSITATAFISDVTLATASADGQLLLWDTSTVKSSKVIEQAHSQSISHISPSSGMVLFATASVDHTINVYEANSLKIVSTIECDGAVRSLTFADNSVIVAGIDEIGLFSYHATNGKCIKQYDFGSGVTASVCATCKSIKQIKILNLSSHNNISGSGVHYIQTASREQCCRINRYYYASQALHTHRGRAPGPGHLPHPAT